MKNLYKIGIATLWLLNNIVTILSFWFYDSFLHKLQTNISFKYMDYLCKTAKNS